MNGREGDEKEKGEMKGDEGARNGEKIRRNSGDFSLNK